MGSFRKRLLVLIIGLGVVTQTVTLAAVLISTRRAVEARAAEQLRSGGSLAEQLIGFRAGQLANGVAVLAADFGFREASAAAKGPPSWPPARNTASASAPIWCCCSIRTAGCSRRPRRRRSRAPDRWRV